MSQAHIMISLDDYLRLKSLLDSSDSDTTQLEGETEPGEVIELFKSAKQAQLIMDQAMDVATRIDIIQSLILEYEEEMLGLARECDPETWTDRFGKDPIEQIEKDVYKLNQLVDALVLSIGEKGAIDLPQACETLSTWADPEILATLQYIFESDYPGFQKIKQLLEEKTASIAALQS